MKIAIAQLNYTVGDAEGNCQKIAAAAQRAKTMGAELLVLSDHAISGHSCLSLAEQPSFEQRCLDAANTLIAPHSHGLSIVLGTPGHPLLIGQGKMERIAPSIPIPIGAERIVVGAEPKRTPLATLAIDLAASAFCADDEQPRLNAYRQRVAQRGLPTLWANLVGGNTERLFHGSSMALGPDGQVRHLLASFDEDFALLDTNTLTSAPTISIDRTAQRISRIHDALVMGIRDYMGKMHLNRAALGLSGGIDSAVVLALLHRAIGPQRIRVLLMPSQYSSQHSIDDALDMAHRLGVQHDIVPIEPLFNTFRQSLSGLFGDLPDDVTEENIQARTRGVLLMALSNKLGHIILNTTNKSEAAVGYGTLYGDTNGAFSALGDVYKTDVYALARHINRHGELIPQNIIDKAPSAELRPNQKDSDSLPPYDVLDSLLRSHIEQGKDTDELVRMGFDPQLVERITEMIRRNVYKRAQTPPAFWVSARPFGQHPLPVVGRWRS